MKNQKHRKHMFLLVMCSVFSLVAGTSPGQAEEKAMELLTGHTVDGETVRFLFDEQVYGFEGKIDSVEVVGDFTEWAPQPDEWSMADPEKDGVWIKEVSTDRVLRGHRFTFIVNGKEWMSPPEGVEQRYLLETDSGGHLLVVGGEPENPYKTHLQALTYTGAEGASLPYRLLIPADYDPAKKYPLVVFLHGSGERGTNNHLQIRIRNGAYEFLETAKDYEFFMLVPQCPSEDVWAKIDHLTVPHVMSDEPTEPMRLVMELIQHMQNEFSIDPARIYSTGLSMGGFGTWDLVVRQPELFAAGITICGGFDDTKAPLIKDIAFKVFHGSEDPWVPAEGSRRMVEALKAEGADVEYIEYEGDGHFVWEPTYTNPEVIEWLFKQSKS